jgi:hypothetical protein
MAVGAQMIGRLYVSIGRISVVSEPDAGYAAALLSAQISVSMVQDVSGS